MHAERIESELTWPGGTDHDPKAHRQLRKRRSDRSAPLGRMNRGGGLRVGDHVFDLSGAQTRIEQYRDRTDRIGCVQSHHEIEVVREQQNDAITRPHAAVM